MLAYVAGALAVVLVFAVLAGALHFLGRLDSRRITKAHGSDAYLRASQVQVLPGSIVARNGR